MTSTEAGYSKRRPSEQSVSVIIPTYNERQNICEVIDRLRASLDRRDYEVIVVDDDSPDGTWRLVRETYEETDRVRVIRRRSAAGLATAVQRGLEAAEKSIYAVLDGDLQHPPEAVPTVLAAFEESHVDVAIGSRYVDGGTIEAWSAYRRAVSRGAGALARLCLPAARGLADPLSGFFAVHRRVVQGVELDPTGFKILLEVLEKCDYETVVEVSYSFSERERGDSNLTVGEYGRFLAHVAQLGVYGRWQPGDGSTVSSVLEQVGVGPWLASTDHSRGD